MLFTGQALGIGLVTKGAILLPSLMMHSPILFYGLSRARVPLRLLWGSAAVAARRQKEPPPPPPERLRKAQGRPGALVSGGEGSFRLLWGAYVGLSSLMVGLSHPKPPPYFKPCVYLWTRYYLIQAKLAEFCHKV